MILITEIIKQETTIDLETLIFFTTSSTTLSDVNKVKDVRDFELDEKCVKQVTVVGRLKKSTLYWKNHLQKCQIFFNISSLIPLKSTPPTFFVKNNKSSIDNSAFVQESIKALLLKGCISEVSEIPKCCSPLTVAVRNSKLRFVLDLRHVNQFVRKFKYEDLKTFSELFDRDDFFVTIFHVDFNFRVPPRRYAS